jgi:hypothetical protein
MSMSGVDATLSSDGDWTRLRVWWANVCTVCFKKFGRPASLQELQSATCSSPLPVQEVNKRDQDQIPFILEFDALNSLLRHP